MQSFRSRVINLLIRKRYLLQGKLHKERFDDNTSIEGFRKQCEESAAKMAKLPKGVKICADPVDGMKAEWIIPEGADSSKVILYVHGGGYVSGSCDDHRAFVAKFAKSCGVTNFLYEYRLAPEFPFPAAVDDSIKAYKFLLDSGREPKNIIFAGESAGGGLTLVLLLALKKNNLPMPAAAVAISPWTDLTCSSESYKTKNKMSAAPLDSWTVFSRHYIGNNNPENPLISPLFGDLAGLPPLFINSGDADELYDEGEKFYLKAKAAGVDVQFRQGKNMIHCYPLLTPMFPEATEAMNEICFFINKNFKWDGVK